MCCSFQLKFSYTLFYVKKKVRLLYDHKKACFTNLKIKTRIFIKHYKLLIKYTRKLTIKLVSKYRIFK